ncbi:hypothetical protein HGP14_23810 [Rhizobium sp. P32RR-XVIII]|uniref:hypothetical protein n=1 Tax=Rhizobium sp. P32RR-XVIII TaxID=2726738 RepID=UPI001457931A|nr:hypothetical protein [Rhizobium sp. P32RR-XVIII]NLS06343.1 hypothetical protein [Rhizobium sp. P32RR-XVIII]
MHLTTRAVLLLLTALPPDHCFARDPAQEIWLSTEDNITLISGHVDGRETRSYRLRIPAAQVITFAVTADNTACGSEIKKTSQRGILTVIDRFPASFSDGAKFGDHYIISFFQSRLAWLDGAICKFSFSVSS